METEAKKPTTVNATPAPASAPVPAPAPAPVSTPEPSPTPVTVATTQKPRWSPIVDRQTKVGLVVFGSFLALVGGVLGVKSLFQVPPPPPEPRSLVEWPVSADPQPKAVNEPTPVARLKAIEIPSIPDVTLAPPPPVITPVRAEVPQIPDIEPPPIVSLPPEPARKESNPVIIPAPIVSLPPEPARKESNPVIIPAPIDDPVLLPVEPMKKEIPTITLPPLDDPAPPPRPIAKDDFKAPPPSIKVEPFKKQEEFELPPPPPTIDLVKPEIKNAVIRIEPAEPKFELPKKADPLPLPKDPPALIELTQKKSDPEFAPKAVVMKDGEYDEDLHTIKPNETYKAISKQYYNSESYSVALLKYNREHPGQADYVRVPPIWVLEKRYANDVAATETRAVNFTSPTPAEATPRNEPVYTVSENGEMLADIARKQLGSEESWKKIWDLNPQLNPAKQVPGGTRLRLP